MILFLVSSFLFSFLNNLLKLDSERTSHKWWGKVISQSTIDFNSRVLYLLVSRIHLYDPLTKNAATTRWIDFHPSFAQPTCISTTKFIIPLFITDSISKRYCLLEIRWISAHKNVIDNSFIKFNSTKVARIIYDQSRIVLFLTTSWAICVNFYICDLSLLSSDTHVICVNFQILAIYIKPGIWWINFDIASYAATCRTIYDWNRYWFILSYCIADVLR